MANPGNHFIQFPCPECGARLKARAAEGGGHLRCPSCQMAVAVPGVAEPTNGSGAGAEDVEYRVLPGVDQPGDDVAAANQVYIPVDCLLCGTRMHGRLDQVGQAITCPDCHTRTVVPPPPPPPKKRELVVPTDEYQLKAEQAAQQANGADVLRRYQVRCPHCGNRSKASQDQLGRRIACPACLMIFVAPAPRPAPEEMAEGETPEHDDELRLSEPAPRRKHSLPTFDLDDRVVRDRRQEYDEPHTERPQRQFTPGERPTLPDWPLVSGVFGFLFSRGVWVRWLSLSAALLLVLFFARSAVLIGQQGPNRTWALAVAYSGLAMAGAGIWFVFGVPILLAIFNDSAAGNEEIEQWPDGLWIDSALESLYLFSALGVTTIVSVATLQLLDYAGVSLTISGAVGGAVWFLAFPVILLSLIEQQSVLVPVSGTVWRSLYVAWPWWLMFYVEVLLLDLAFGVVGMLLTRIANPVTGGWAGAAVLCIGATIAVGFMFLYFRLLGRLAWCCEEALAAREEQREAVGQASVEEDGEPASEFVSSARSPSPPAADRAPHRGSRNGAARRPIVDSDEDGDFLSGI